MNVEQIMTSEPVTVSPDATLDDAVLLMDRKYVRHLPVVNGDEFVGVISDRDLLEATGWLPARVRAVPGCAAPSTKRVVADILHEHVMTVTRKEHVITLAVEAVVQGIGCLPVVEGGKLVGIVTEMDVLRAFVEHARDGGTDFEQPTLQELMTHTPITLQVDAELTQAVEAFKRVGAHHVPVTRYGQLVGILSDRDLRRARGAGRPGNFPIDELMTRDPDTLAPSEPLEAAAKLMLEHRISAVPVVDNNGLVGIITLMDMCDYCANHLRESTAS